MTLTATDGITVSPGGILKGHGNIIGDVIYNGGIVRGGMPEPSTGVLMMLGVLGVVCWRGYPNRQPCCCVC